MQTNNNKDLMKNADWRFFWAIVEKWGRGIFVEDAKGMVLLVNEAFCKIFMPDKKLEDLFGTSSSELIEAVGKLITKRREFSAQMKKVIQSKDRVQDQEIRLLDGRLFEIDCIPVVSGGIFLGRIWEFHEGTTLREVEEKLLARNTELEKINKVMVGRELKMIELKTEIERLRKLLNEKLGK